jgi:hypothetical protein
MSDVLEFRHLKNIVAVAEEAHQRLTALLIAAGINPGASCVGERQTMFNGCSRQDTGLRLWIEQQFSTLV